MLSVQGLYGHIRKNDTRSLALFLGFALAVEVMALGFFVPVLLFMKIGASLGGESRFPWATLGWYFAGGLGIGLAWFVHHLVRHVKDAREGSGFAFIERSRERRFHDLLEQLAIANGLPCPRAAIIESPALNAFACGLTRRSAVVVVTRGLLESLDDDELAAVLAHELAHVRLADIRLMACAHAGLSAILSIENRIAPKIGWRAVFLIVAPIHLIMMLAFKVTGLLARFLAYLARIMISRSREFVADGVAIEMTKNPGALITALQKISGRSALPQMPSSVEAMLIDGPTTGGLASHPAIGERIAAIRRHAGAMIDLAGPRKDTRERAAGAFDQRHVSATPGAFGRRNAAAPADGLAAARAVLKAAASGERGAPDPSHWQTFMAYPLKKKVASVGAGVAVYAALVMGSNYIPGMAPTTFSSTDTVKSAPGQPAPKARAKPDCADPSCRSGLRNTIAPSR
ncbi:MAG: M48 family metalloprotease [Methylobacteriaceae bacterium]|nr:M48 family metalloprotease [Methylobacteriaceae bacterium]